MSDGFPQNPALDYPIYVSVSNAGVPVSVTLNTGVLPFAYPQPSYDYADWASPGDVVFVEGTQMGIVVGGFSVSARQSAINRTDVNVRFGGNIAVTAVVGDELDASGTGGAQRYVTGNSVQAYAGTVNVPLSIGVSVNVTSPPMTISRGSVVIGASLTGNSMEAQVGDVGVPQPTLILISMTTTSMTARVAGVALEQEQQVTVTGNFMTMQQGSVFTSIPGSAGVGANDREGMMVSSNWMGS